LDVQNNSSNSHQNQVANNLREVILQMQDVNPFT